MAQTLDSLIIKVLFDNKELQASAKKMGDTVDAFAKNVESTLKGAFGAFTGGFVLNFAKNLAESFVEVNSKLGFLSQTLHTNAKGLALWEEAYKRVGGTAEGFSTTISGIFDKLNQAQLNQDPKTLGILNILGVSPMQDGKRKDILKVYEQTVNALHKLPYGTRRSLAQQLGFDDAGIRLIDKTNEELEASFAHYEKLGVSSQKRTQEAIELRNKWLDVQQEWGNIGQDLVSSFMPELEQLSKWAMDFVDYLQEHKEEVKLFFEGMIAASVILIASNPFTAWTAALTALLALLPQFMGWIKQFPTISKFLDHVTATLKDHPFSQLGDVVADTIHAVSGDYGKTAESIAPAIRQIESSGGKNINSGNGAYGDYQIRPNWGNKARVKAGLSAQSPQWYLDPKNSYDTYKLMLEQNLAEHHGNLEAAIREYSGGHYGLDAVNAANRKLPTNANLQSTSYTKQTNNTNTQASIHVGSVNLPSVANPSEFTNKMIDMTKTGYVFSSGILA